MVIGLRETLTWMLDGQELIRLGAKGFSYNQEYGMVYMEYKTTSSNTTTLIRVTVMLWWNLVFFQFP